MEKVSFFKYFYNGEQKWKLQINNQQLYEPRPNGNSR